MKSILLLGALLMANAPAAKATSTAPPAPRSCHLPGVEDALRCLVLPVPLEPGKPASSTGQGMRMDSPLLASRRVQPAWASSLSSV